MYEIWDVLIKYLKYIFFTTVATEFKYFILQRVLLVIFSILLSFLSQGHVDCVSVTFKMNWIQNFLAQVNLENQFPAPPLMPPLWQRLHNLFSFYRMQTHWVTFVFVSAFRLFLWVGCEFWIVEAVLLGWQGAAGWGRPEPSHLATTAALWLSPARTALIFGKEL